jgi:hypothetical protein
MYIIYNISQQLLQLFRSHVSPTELERKKRNRNSFAEPIANRNRREATAEEAKAKQLTTAEEELELLEVMDEVFRGRRQSSDPDQLCPTVASYIMPRAAVNSKGRLCLAIVFSIETFSSARFTFLIVDFAENFI